MYCPSAKKAGPIYKLYPIWEDGLHRLGGGLSWTAVPQESKQPIILGHTLYEQALENSGEEKLPPLFSNTYINR